MLFKWIWRYGSEPDILWHKVIADRYESSSLALMPANTKPSNKSFIWRNILSPLNSSDNCLVENIRYVVGDGKRIQFWADVWIGEQALKFPFPEYFNVKQAKQPKVDWCPLFKGELKFNTMELLLAVMANRGFEAAYVMLSQNALSLFPNQ
ncbi:hypothetical protein V6N13_080343 [Hibiscus sabdariffa]